MKIYSRIITRRDIYEALIGILEVCIDSDGVREFSPRRGGFGYELYLEGYGDRHYRARNNRDGYAATWDDYGVWMDRLFKIDPDAEIGYWKGRQEFIELTAQYAPNMRARAPWLEEDVSPPYTWPDELQVEADRERIERKRKREIRAEARALRARAERLEATLTT